jgi:hypothetical protein
MSVGPWGAGAWDTGSWGESSGDIAVLSGNSAQGSVGEVRFGIFVSVNVTGVSAETQLGEEEGVAGFGWGSNAWGEPIGWGGVLSVEVFPTGVEGLGVTGIAEADAKATVVLTGEAALGLLETGVAVDAGSNHGVVGQQATINIGEVTVKGKANITPTGVVGVGAIGTAEIDAKATVNVTGVQGNTALGEEEVDGKVRVFPTGVSASGRLGVEEVDGAAIVNVTGVAGTVVLGQVRQASSNTVMVTGVAGTISQGSVAIDGKATVYLTGVSATGRVARPLVWGLIDTSQNPNWVPIAA